LQELYGVYLYVEEAAPSLLSFFDILILPGVAVGAAKGTAPVGVYDKVSQIYLGRREKLFCFDAVYFHIF
jgi:hypothetical protein